MPDANNTEELAAALQRALAEHDIRQARIVLQVYDDANENAGSANRNVQVLIEQYTKGLPGNEDGKALQYSCEQDERGASPAALLEQLERLNPDKPLASPAQQSSPPPRAHSTSERRTHNHSPALQLPSDDDNVMPASESPSAETLLAPTSAASQDEKQAMHPCPPSTTDSSSAYRRPSDILTPAVARHTHPIEPVKRSLSGSARELAATQPPSITAADADPPTEVKPYDVEAFLQSGGSGIMHGLSSEIEDVLRRKAESAERIRILNSYLGKSTLLADRKQREQSPKKVSLTFSALRNGLTHLQRTDESQPKQASCQLNAPSSTVKGTSSLHLPPKDPGKPTLPRTQGHVASNAKHGGVRGHTIGSEGRRSSTSGNVSGFNAVPASFLCDRHNSRDCVGDTRTSIIITGHSQSHATHGSCDLPPVENTNKGGRPFVPSASTASNGTRFDSKTLTAASRENSLRASRISTTSHSFTPINTDVDVPAKPKPSTTSLQEMLRDQRKMDERNAADMQRHAAAMHAARDFMAKAVGGTCQPSQSTAPTQRSQSSLPPADLSTAQTSPAATHKPSLGVPAAVPLSTSVGERTFPPYAPATRSGTSSVSSSIQVVKFDLPRDDQAKQAVVAQLSRSSAGQQHISTKDKYRALLQEQRSELHEHEARQNDYAKVIEMAVEYNKTLGAH